MADPEPLLLADATAWLAAIVEGSDDAIVSKDTDGLIRSWNPAAERLFGYRAEEIMGLPVSTLAPSDRLDELAGILARIHRGERVDHLETLRRRKNGELVPVLLTVSPVRDARGRIVGASKIIRDITEQQRARERQSLLIAELNHRVKNTLATVQAIARQMLRTADDLQSFGPLFESRLMALSHAHSQLTAGAWSDVPVANLVEAVLRPFRGTEKAFELNGEAVMLPAGSVLMLALALHELATNAAKHGALSQAAGVVHISWRQETGRNGPEVLIEWRECGGPPILNAPTRRGFGLRLLQRLAPQELAGHADLAFHETGLVWRAAFPLDA